MKKAPYLFKSALGSTGATCKNRILSEYSAISPALRSSQEELLHYLDFVKCRSEKGQRPSS